uniref:nitroreductase family protein n=1 Tax=Veillonella magna TaxID=464322 RepID=UPI00402AE3E7
MIDMIAAKRRSIRRFTGESIDETTIRELLVTAGRAPSGKNRQPWHFTVVTGKAKRELASILWQTAIDKESRGKVFGSLRISARAMEEAGAVILIGNRYAPLEQDYNDKRYRRVMDTQSIGAAIQTMLLAATLKGLGSLWICDVCQCEEAIQAWWGREDQLVAAIAIGVPAELPYPRWREDVDTLTEWRSE